MATKQSSTAPSLEFPQPPFSGQLINSLLGLVTTISARAEVIAQHVPTKPALEDCQFQEEGWPCYHPAVVFDLASEQEFCRRHFSRVALAAALTELDRG